jgi:hypothetical protein
MAIALTAVVTFVITALAAAVLLERARLADLTRTVREQAGEIAQLKQLLANLERVGRNKLYREALEDKQTQVVQAALRLRVARQDLDDAMRILNLEPKE